MSRKCQITGKGSQRGCKVSHAHNVSLKRWDANLQWKRLFDSESGKFVRVKVSARVLRTISRKGLAQTLRDNGLSVKDFA